MRADEVNISAMPVMDGELVEPVEILMVSVHKLGPRASPAERVAWGEEKGMERVKSSLQAGTEQSGISSDEVNGFSSSQLSQ